MWRERERLTTAHVDHWLSWSQKILLYGSRRLCKYLENYALILVRTKRWVRIRENSYVMSIGLTTRSPTRRWPRSEKRSCTGMTITEGSCHGVGIHLHTIATRESTKALRFVSKFEWVSLSLCGLRLAHWTPCGQLKDSHNHPFIIPSISLTEVSFDLCHA